MQPHSARVSLPMKAFAGEPHSRTAETASDLLWVVTLLARGHSQPKLASPQVSEF